ncbi:MAG: hydrogen gas-evolving membrane-bound hydrogenase subunit E [Lachnospiraceae bacterium]
MRKVSKLKSNFLDWLEGKEDPYLGKVEMQEQEEYCIEEDSIQERMREKERMYEKIYDFDKNIEIKAFNKIYEVGSVVFCIVLIGLLLITISFLPKTGNAKNPDNNEVSKRYIEEGMQETGAVNIVTGIILDYRAFDTLGESHVLFVAAITVLILLQKEKDKKDDQKYEPHNDIILQKIAFILVPIILLFGIYIVLNGHLSPGGGFSGGAVMGAALILYSNAYGFEKTEKFFTKKTYKWVCFFCLSFYCLAKSYSFFTGANHLESIIKVGTIGNIMSAGLILPLNICVGLIVASTMYTFYALARKV